jgi:hypothetical protein
MCLSLLTMQVSGQHLHVNAEGQGGALHGLHLHHAHMDGHGHDYDAEIDVSLFDKGSTTWTKLAPFLVGLVVVLLVIIRTGTTRWRPPLRAPPRYIH